MNVVENIDFDAVDVYGRNCLVRACLDGDLEKLKYLNENCGSIDVLRKYGSSCLHCACYNNQIDVVEYLLEQGMDVNGKFNGNIQPLHESCRGKVDSGIVKVLLQAGAEINVKTDIGHTPYVFACLNGDIQSVKALLEAGCDYTVHNSVGQTGLECARFNKNKEVFLWLSGYLKKMQISIQNCRKSVVAVLCVAKRKEEMKQFKLNRDVVGVIAKMIWKTRREVESWIEQERAITMENYGEDRIKRQDF